MLSATAWSAESARRDGGLAIALGAGNLGRGQERLSSAGHGLTIAGLTVGVVCLLLTLPFLMGSID